MSLGDNLIPSSGAVSQVTAVMQLDSMGTLALPSTSLGFPSMDLYGSKSSI